MEKLNTINQFIQEVQGELKRTGNPFHGAVEVIEKLDSLQKKASILVAYFNDYGKEERRGGFVEGLLFAQEILKGAGQQSKALEDFTEILYNVVTGNNIKVDKEKVKNDYDTVFNKYNSYLDEIWEIWGED